MNAGKRASAPRDLLVELGTEELPPKALKRLSVEFASGIFNWLKEQGFVEANTESESNQWQWYASPRRLAVVIEKVISRQGNQVIERRGPALAAAFDKDGQPTRAATGFAGSCGVEVGALETLKTDKGEWLVHRSETPGKLLNDVIEECIVDVIGRLPIPKRMRWGSGDAEFVRPVHWLVVLHGGDLLDANVLGVSSGRYSQGHRFHAPGRLNITSAARYAEILKDKGSVWADFEERKLEIYLQVEKLAAKLKGQAVIDDVLLDEVTGLVERPESICGRFDEAFLEVPTECLVSSMSDHQKYFHVVDKSGSLMPFFITVSNIRSSDPARVRTGNERVLRARLSDADFFWRGDLAHTLESRLSELEGLMFHNALGSVADKTRRIVEIARKVARQVEGDVDACARAALLCKADLVTAMVGEFPELEGIMGRYYAINDGETTDIARAIEEHYRPRHAGDALPAELTGRVVAMADKIDTLTGIYATGEEPTGDKDPYGLRRTALGLIRIIIEDGIDLDIAQLVEFSAAQFERQDIKVSRQARQRAVAFVVDRYPAHFAASGFAVDEIAAVGSVRPLRPLDVEKRLRAIAAFRTLPAAVSLAAANKRIANILKKVDASIERSMDFDRLVEPAETALAEQLVRVSSQVASLVQRSDYDDALEVLAGFRESVDRFFDEVMVMDPDPSLRDNRLALLMQLSGLFMGIADLSKLQSTERSQ
ncbi:MAG: glycine--tRNA ligase beta subunit [marine bacterium B5-7]|nr:MAG: glycine--tRNA ligase beta subunit [marine bacterium B5-7]